MRHNLKDLRGKRLTIQLDWDKEWKVAICKELEVSGMGDTIDDALTALAVSIQSHVHLMEKLDS